MYLYRECTYNITDTQVFVLMLIPKKMCFFFTIDSDKRQLAVEQITNQLRQFC